MAGDWIKMRTNLWDDPRVSQICDMTGAQEATVIGGLYWLWSSADEHTEDGFMPGLSKTGIDRKTGIKGIGEALVAVKWIEDGSDGITISNFIEHNGTSAKKRCQTAKRVANHAAANAGMPKEDENANADSVSSALAREEKRERREDVNLKNLTNPNGLVVASDADNPPESSPEISKVSDCPHQKIIALYHEILPQCPAVREWTPARATQLRARWNEDPGRQNMEYWRRFFEYVKTCDFLVGVQPDSRRKPFFADLEWIVKHANFTKIRERKYEPR